MSNLDMTEAIRMLAGDRGISVDSLLQVLVEALATAYKKRQGAAEEVGSPGFWSGTIRM